MESGGCRFYSTTTMKYVTYLQERILSLVGPQKAALMGIHADCIESTPKPPPPVRGQLATLRENRNS